MLFRFPQQIYALYLSRSLWCHCLLGLGFLGFSFSHRICLLVCLWPRIRKELVLMARLFYVFYFFRQFNLFVFLLSCAVRILLQLIVFCLLMKTAWLWLLQYWMYFLRDREIIWFCFTIKSSIFLRWYRLWDCCRIGRGSWVCYQESTWSFWWWV